MRGVHAVIIPAPKAQINKRREVDVAEFDDMIYAVDFPKDFLKVCLTEKCVSGKKIAMVFKKLFSKFGTMPPPRAVYAVIVAKARQPWLYTTAGVADTVTGRFDMITLHCFLVLERLRDQGEKASEFAQEIFDEAFMDMDHSLREMGVGDLSVGKKVRKMSEVFYGACKGYRDALSVDEPDIEKELAGALRRNVLGEKATDQQVHALVQYVLKSTQQLAAYPVSEIVSGKLELPDIVEDIV